MAGPVHPLRLGLLAVFLCPAAQAQTATPPAAPVMTAPTVASEPAASPKLERLFAGAPPKFDPPKPAAATPAPGAQPRNAIIRLPLYLVREPRVISDDDILTQQGRDAAMAKRYLGTPTDAERVLNAFTLTDLWSRIPFLGRIPFAPFGSMSYEQRAAVIYERVEKKRRFNELLDIERIGREIDQAEAAKPDTKASSK